MASAQVFDTTELLEMILYKLPIRDLLFAQRIAKQWKAVIDNSVKLQQALFFRPVPIEPVLFVIAPHFDTTREGCKKSFRFDQKCVASACSIHC